MRQAPSILLLHGAKTRRAIKYRGIRYEIGDPLPALSEQQAGELGAAILDTTDARLDEAPAPPSPDTNAQPGATGLSGQAAPAAGDEGKPAAIYSAGTATVQVHELAGVEATVIERIEPGSHRVDVNFEPAQTTAQETEGTGEPTGTHTSAGEKTEAGAEETAGASAPAAAAGDATGKGGDAGPLASETGAKTEEKAPQTQKPPKPAKPAKGGTTTKPRGRR